MSQQTHSAVLVTVTDDTFTEKVLAADRPVVVDFWAEWCPPCKVISKTLGELAEEFGERITVATLDADANPVVTRTYGIMSMPTLLVFRQGEVVARMVGARPKGQLREFLQAHAAS